MKLPIQTSNILNSAKWQLLKNSQDNATSIVTYIKETYDNPKKVTQATIDIYNSLHNIEQNNITISQFCKWVELNQGERIKNKKDFVYIVNTIANNA